MNYLFIICFFSISHNLSVVPHFFHVDIFVELKVNNDTLYIQDIGDYGNDTDLLVAGIEKASFNKQVLKLEGRVYYLEFFNVKHPVEIVGIKGSTVFRPLKSLDVFLRSTASLSVSNIVFDGKSLVSTGIYSEADLIMYQNEIINFKGTDRVRGMGIRHTPFNKKLVISNCVFKNIHGYEDGISGNAVGAHRGVLTKGEGLVRISNSQFIDIQGSEDGDCIHIHTARDKESNWGSAGDVLIQNNYFENFGKRAIKLQASDVVVRNNQIVSKRIYNDRRPLTAIGIFGDNNVVENNVIYLENSETGIMTSTGIGNLIRYNKITFGSNSAPLAAIFWGREAKSNEVHNNIIEGPENINKFRFSKFIDPKSRARIRTSNLLNEEL